MATTSRSISPSRPIPAGRDTNSNETKALRCRVFVGNLATEKTSKREIEEIFSKFGAITSCSLHNNFGFVQFVDEKCADDAVNGLHGSDLFGKRIDVNLAGLRRKAQAKDKYEEPPQKEQIVPADMMKYGEKRPQRRRSRSPMRGGRDSGRRSLSPMSRYEELYRKDDQYGRPPNSGRGYPSSYDDRSRDYPLDRRGDPPYGLSRRPDDAYSREYPPREDPYIRRSQYDDYRPPPTVRSRPAIDCEIVSLSKDDSHYAEDVESRLRSIGLVCNIGYPPPELSVIEVIDRIARCGTLYAIVVSAQNSQHRSCTLNVLHGTRQEHRNMPLDDALSFVARNFDTYLRVLREPHYPPPAQAVYGGRDVLPRGYPSYSSHPPQSHVSGGLPETEKKLSNDELTDMIEKLKREKEQREKGPDTVPASTYNQSSSSYQSQSAPSGNPNSQYSTAYAASSLQPNSVTPATNNSAQQSTSSSYYEQQPSYYNQPVYR